ncbi:DUF4912 domain-containing protein [Orenia marismortui]|uniref:Helix-hairpin-helix DNA-binding motif class 1 domain-containing protein n=1 Tax=Orenia marismortui TaxID=46469 RepID=A0A4R8H0I5_9FIRM|nr:DUF4912 domain-containing protein [Orenia marismortui]TDX52918.1 hypothetical protein C7959_10443 [Orenia marismortui]
MAVEKLTSIKVNINTAMSEELTRLKGIGPALAKRIINYRKNKGKFHSLEEIKKVSGIGKKLFASIKSNITNEIQEVNLKQLDEEESPSSSGSSSDLSLVEDAKDDQEDNIDNLNQYQIPESYASNKLVLQVKNPKTAHLYWEYTNDKVEEIIAQTEYSDISEVNLVLKIYNLSKKSEQYINIGLDNDSWWLNGMEADQTYFAELGFLDEKDNFYSILESNKVTMPVNKISDNLDEQWMTVKEKMDEIYVLSGSLLYQNENNNYSSKDVVRKLESITDLSKLEESYSSDNLLDGSSEIQ